MKKIHKVLEIFIGSALLLGALVSCGEKSAQTRQVEVWDFGGVQQEGALNHITKEAIDSLSDENLASDGKFKKGDIVFGDLTLNTDNNDRAYYGNEANPGKKNYGTQGYQSFTFDDGYTSNGIYYANGKGGEGKRYMLLQNVQAGDVISFYARTSNSGDEIVHFANVDDELVKTGIQDETAPIISESKKYTYIASVSGKYKVYVDATVGKPVYYRLVRTPSVTVTGEIKNLKGNAELKFIVKETNQELSATINGNKYNATLPAGYTFTAVLQGVQGFGISPETRIVTLDGKLAGTSSKVNLSVSESKSYKVDGNISGIDSKYDTSKLNVTFNPPEGGIYQPVVGTVNGLSYSANLEPGVSYTAELFGANDYEIVNGAKFDFTENKTQEIVVSAKKTFAISGKFFGEVSEIPSKITFTRLDDEYSYEGSISGNTYSVSLRDGSYSVSAETSKASTSNHIVVSGKEVSKDIKLSLKDKTIAQIPLRKSISVGKTKEFQSVNSALKAATAMNPQSEADRITITIEPGIYREQIFVNVPFVTLKNANPSKEVKLTWYYGIGYNYYSADKDGWFDEDLAYDKFTKKGVAKWGGATYIKSNAKSFKAEGITFETSFNKYVTDEEIADGVEEDGSIKFTRNFNSDVRSKAGTERAAAILIEADEAEFRNCRFLGSQDTFYTGAKIKGYLRNCFIEGNTDFIFGDGDFVFENCEIRLAGYTDKAAVGYLTAARTSSEKGYLFLNCLVSRDENVYNAPSFFGRPWGADANVAFVNTVLGNPNAIDAKGWTSMSGNQPEKAKFKEVNTIWEGDNLNTSERIVKPTSDDGSYTLENYLGNWKPSFAERKATSVSFAKKPSFTTDDDINTPYPGHTITLHYSLGSADSEDASRIYWFREKDGKSELVKQSTGYGDKTYLIQKEDSGSIITAKVSPRVTSGASGSEAEAKLDAKINEGYAVPSNAAADVPRILGAVNVFLASDSTCKDYSAKGMWSSNQTRNEGSWGEFLQNFFNSAVAIQNYANGGRSTRNFINEGTLDKIAEKISKGDYLFIQFGHNDSSNDSGYLEDRYVPLGKADASGIYPTNEGKKVPTPDSYKAKYGDNFYSWDNGGTYKWYLKKYIEVAKKVGATPVLVTPVSRLYFSEGKIRPHHDSDKDTPNTIKTSGNAYVEAVRQLAREEKVILIDGFEITKNLYEKAYADKGNDSEARALMFSGDSTHNNKLGGFIIAGEFAKAIKKQIPELAKSVKKPTKAIGENSDGTLMFTVDSEGNFKCYNEYWTKFEQIELKKF